MGRIQVELQRDLLLSGLPEIPEEQQGALVDQFLQDQGLTSATAAKDWIRAQHLSAEDLQAQAVRQALWLQVCEQQFSAQLPSYFLKRKPQLDQVSYWAMTILDEPLSQELHQRLKEGECSFEQLLVQYPPAPDGPHSGHFGPLSLAELPTGLAELLRVSRPGQLWPPKPLQEGWLLVQLDASKPAVLDQQLRRQLLFELGEQLLEPAPADATSKSPAVGV